MVKSLIWEFSTDDEPDSSTIYGTIHLGTPECLTHWINIEKAMGSYNTIYTESSLHQEDLEYLQPFTLLADNEHVSDYITDRRWKKMRETYKKYCEIDIDHYRIFKPLFLMAQLQSQLIGASGMEPLDHKIWNKAKSDGKETAGIESAQEQVAILLGLNLGQQYLNLVQMSKRISKTRSKLRCLLDAYVDQDIDNLYKMSKSTLGKDRAGLVKNRNYIIAKRIIDFHNHQPSFFSFGAGHMAGGHGVLRLLKQSGAHLKAVTIG